MNKADTGRGQSILSMISDSLSHRLKSLRVFTQSDEVRDLALTEPLRILTCCGNFGPLVCPKNLLTNFFPPRLSNPARSESAVQTGGRQCNRQKLLRSHFHPSFPTTRATTRLPSSLPS